MIAHLKQLNWRRVIRLAIVAAVTAVITLVITAGVVVELLRDKDGRVWLLHSGLALANGRLGSFTIEADDVAAPELGHWRFARLAIRQDDQRLVELEGVELLFNWRALSNKEVVIEQLTADRVTYFHQPASSPTPDNEATIQLPNIDIRPWRVSVSELATASLQVLAAENRQRIAPDTRFNAAFDLWRNDVPVQGTLKGRSLPTPGFDITPITVDISSTLAGSDRLSLVASAKEAAGGWLAGQLALPQAQALTINTELTLHLREQGYDIQLLSLAFPWFGHQCELAGQLIVNPTLTSFSLNDGRLDIDQHRQTLQGTWQRGELNLQMALAQLPLTIVEPWWRPMQGGWVTGALTLQGPLDALAVTTDIQFAVSAEQQGQQWQAAGQLNGHYKPQHFDITAAQLKLDWQREAEQASGSIALKGTLDLANQYINLSGQVPQLDSDLIKVLLHTASIEVPEQLRPLQAGMQLQRFSLKGNIQNELREIQTEIVAKAQGNYAGEPVKLQLDMLGSWQKFRLQESRLDYATSHLSAEGKVDVLGQGNDFNARLTNFDTGLINAQLLKNLAVPFEIPPQIDATMGRAMIDGALTVKGNLQQPQTHFDATASLNESLLDRPIKIALAGKSEASKVFIDTLNITTELSSEVAVTEGAEGDITPTKTAAAKLAASLQLSGELDMQTTLPAMRWQVQTENLPLQLAAAAGWPDPEGVLSSHLTMSMPGAKNFSADWLANVSIKGNFDYRSGALVLADGDAVDAVSQVHWAGEIADTSEQQMLTLDSTIALVGSDTETAGHINISTDKKTLADYIVDKKHLPAAKIQTQVDLHVLDFVLPSGTELTGILNANVTVAGRVESPQVTGKLALDAAHIASEDLGVTLSPITIAAEAKGQALHMTQFSAEDGRGGELKAEGWINWSDINASNAVNISVQAHQLNLIERDEIHGEVSGELALTGSLQHWLLAGALQVQPLTVSIENDLPGADIPSINVRYRQDDEEEVADWIPTLELDIALRADSRAYLRGRGLDAELAGALHLGGTLDKLKIAGGFNVVRGHFELLGNRFTLTEGSANFSNDSLTLLVTGEHSKGGKTITAVLAGTDERLEFTLTSDPEMPEDEIIAWMMFGASIDEISAAQALQLAAAVSTLRGGGFDPIGKTRDFIGADTLILDTQETDEGTGLSIGAGKYLTEKVYLELERTPDPADPWRSTITIELTPRLSLRSSLSSGTAGDGVEVRWQRDY